MLNVSFNLSNVKYSMFSLFLKNVEDWFDCGKLNVFHISASSCLSFNVKQITGEQQLQQHRIFYTR